MFYLGDFNTDVLSSKSTSLLSAYRYFSNLFSLKQIINDCTRISSTCSTVIDLILKTDIGKVSQSGTISCDLSDNKLVFLYEKSPLRSSFEYQCYSNEID